MEGYSMLLVRRNNTVTITLLPEAITDSMQCLSNYNSIFHRTRKKISQFLWKHKGPWIAKIILGKKNGAEGINLPDFIL